MWVLWDLGVCAHHWARRAKLCSVWEGGRLVQAQLTPKSSPGIPWPQALHHKGFAAVFFSSWTLPCECLEREVSRASGRKWEDGGEIKL